VPGPAKPSHLGSNPTVASFLSRVIADRRSRSRVPLLPGPLPGPGRGHQRRHGLDQLQLVQALGPSALHRDRLEGIHRRTGQQRHPRPLDRRRPEGELHHDRQRHAPDTAQLAAVSGLDTGTRATCSIGVFEPRQLTFIALEEHAPQPPTAPTTFFTPLPRQRPLPPSLPPDSAASRPCRSRRPASTEAAPARAAAGVVGRAAREPPPRL